MTLIDKTPFICRFFRHFIQFSIGLLYKDVTQSDRIQRCDVTVSSEAFGCFRNVFGQFKIYTFQTLINKLLSTKKFRKIFCMQKSPPNFIFSSQKKCANSQFMLFGCDDSGWVSWCVTVVEEHFFFAKWGREFFNFSSSRSKNWLCPVKRIALKRLKSSFDSNPRFGISFKGTRKSN